MQILQGMTTNQMVIIFPSALIAMYLVITLQKHLCERENKYIGLVLPVLCFVAATVLAIYPLITSSSSEYDGLLMFCVRMWLAFNIPTILFGFQYFRQRRTRAAIAKQEAEIYAEEAAGEIAEEAAGEIADGYADRASEEYTGEQAEEEALDLTEEADQSGMSRR